MDGANLAIIIPSIMAVITALISLYLVIVRGNTKIKVDDATLIRSNLIPTAEWLRRENELNLRLQKMEDRIDSVTAENYRLTGENSQLRQEVKTLTDRTNEQDKIIEDLQKQITHNVT